MMNYSLQLYKSSVIKDSRGITTKTFLPITWIDGVFLPIGGEQAAKEYGITIPVDFQFFTKDEHVDLIIGNRLQHQSTFYEIVYLADYVKIRLCLCRAVS